jgi:hypothetical protein
MCSSSCISAPDCCKIGAGLKSQADGLIVQYCMYHCMDGSVSKDTRDARISRDVRNSKDASNTRSASKSRNASNTRKASNSINASNNRDQSYSRNTNIGRPATVKTSGTQGMPATAELAAVTPTTSKGKDANNNMASRSSGTQATQQQDH